MPLLNKYRPAVVLILFVANCHFLSGQQLSKAAMYADFDTLVSTIAKVSPHIPVKKDLWHYDALRQMKKLRNAIDTIRNDDSFVLLINQVLTLAQDHHTSLMQDMPEWFQAGDNRFNLYLPVCYLNGKYYTARTLILEGDTIPIGTEILKINGLKIDHYVEKNLRSRVFNFDLHFNKFYSTEFYRNSATIQAGYFTLVFNQKNKRNYRLSTEQELRFTHVLKDTIFGTKVEYWAQSRTLYIKCPFMDKKLIPVFQRKIAKFRDKNIQQAIVDLRNNPGGNDVVWQAIYAAILPDTFRYKAHIDGFYPDFADKNYLLDHEINPDRIKPDPAPVPAKYNFSIWSDEFQEIIPSDSSLHIRGNIFVLADNIYSAGASALSVPNAVAGDKIISIGQKSNFFLGAGYSPVLFELPNSQIRYRIAPSLECPEGASTADLMNDKYEIEIKTTMEDYIARENYDGNTLGGYFLQHYDPFIKKAMQYGHK